MKMNTEVVMVKLSDIIPNRFQPRLTFDEEALNELANSIKEHGIIQPLILRDLGSKYEIIAGERRYKASTIAGLTEVPAIVGSMDDQTSAELALIENIQRKDLSAIEEAKSYKKILDMGNFTQEELAKRMGKSQSTIANKMRLLSLTNEVQVALMNNLISERHARCLLQIKDEDLQKQVLNKIISERINVRDTDEYIKNLLGLSKELPPQVDNSNHNIDLTTPIDSTINPLYNSTSPSVEEHQPEEKNDNPNVYTQTQNMDFVNISTLDNEVPSQNIKNEIEPKSTEEERNNTSMPETILFDNAQQQESVQSTTIDSNNDLSKIKFATAIKLAKEAVKNIELAGYEAILEEQDTADGYQIIIKIQK